MQKTVTSFVNELQQHWEGKYLTDAQYNTLKDCVALAGEPTCVRIIYRSPRSWKQGADGFNIFWNTKNGTLTHVSVWKDNSITFSFDKNPRTATSCNLTPVSKAEYPSAQTLLKDSKVRAVFDYVRNADLKPGRTLEILDEYP